MPRQLQEGRRWKDIRDRFKARCQAQRAPCIHCHQVIDYTAKAARPDSFEADHRHPASTHPHLAYDETNLMPSHSSCNRSRGVKPLDQQPAWVTPDW